LLFLLSKPEEGWKVVRFKPEQLITDFLDKSQLHYYSKTVFGEPVRYEQSLIIPVSKVRIGYGYGLGRTLSTEEGQGAGIGLVASPVGYLELKPEETRFKRIRLYSFVPFLATLSLSGLILLSYRFLRKKLK
jgi:hypothetical protein